MSTLFDSFWVEQFIDTSKLAYYGHCVSFWVNQFIDTSNLAHYGHPFCQLLGGTVH